MKEIIKPSFFPIIFSKSDYRESPLNFIKFGFKNIVQNTKECWYWAEDFVHRGFYGFAKSDVWSLDDYLLRVLVGGLEILRQKGHSYSCSCYKHNFAEECHCLEKWNEKLDEMIEGFQGSWVSMYDELSEEDKTKFNKSMKLLQENFFDLWD